MSSRELPVRASLEHLKAEAKALLRSAQAGDPNAVARAHAALGDAPLSKLSDAQRVIAREYGFPTWALLRDHVRVLRAGDAPVEAFLAAVHEGSGDGAARIVDAHPAIATQSLHVAAALGDVANVERLLAADPAQLHQRRGNPTGDPLLYLCYSPFHHETAERDARLLAAAKLLLAAGADPNTRDGRYNVPALFAVTAQRSVPVLARLLIDAGASPNDGESLFHSAERARVDSLELLLAAGADVNHVAEAGNTALYFLLRWYDIARQPRVREGFEWLLAHGADPNIPSGRERETALHVAARRGQGVAIVRALLERGANVHARRADGATAWLLARRRGEDAIVDLLEREGAEREALTPLDELLDACGRGDVDAAARLGSPALVARVTPEDRRLLLEAAAAGREHTVAACLAAGFAVNTEDEHGATVLHHAAIHGETAIVRRLLAANASIGIRDREHQSTPLGWACFGADFFLESRGDYVATVSSLLAAGARPATDEYVAANAAVRALLAPYLPGAPTADDGTPGA